MPAPRILEARLVDFGDGRGQYKSNPEAAIVPNFRANGEPSFPVWRIACRVK